MHKKYSLLTKKILMSMDDDIKAHIIQREVLNVFWASLMGFKGAFNKNAR